MLRLPDKTAVIIDTCGYGFNIARRILIPGEAPQWVYQCRTQLMNRAQRDAAAKRLIGEGYELFYVTDFFQRIPADMLEADLAEAYRRDYNIFIGQG